MIDRTDEIGEERDSLHILPLMTVPLHISSLQKARLLKNTRLEGMVELFSGEGVGSGQIHPGELSKVFDFSAEKKGDLKIITALSKLPSYDVFSLRVEMRKLGINVEEHEHLRLSETMTAMLSDYMHVFTKPLISMIYGDAARNVGSYKDMLLLFMSPNQDDARKNLQNLATMLNIRITDIPMFLQDYADVYLSLAYYRHCNDDNIEKMTEFLEWLHKLQQDPIAYANRGFIRASHVVEKVVKSTADEVQYTLEMFESRTSDMWEDPTADKFQTIKKLISEYQSQIGGALCVVSVKLDAWAEQFSVNTPRGVHKQMEFIMSDMHHGLDQIQRISYSDAPS